MHGSRVRSPEGFIEGKVGLRCELLACILWGIAKGAVIDIFVKWGLFAVGCKHFLFNELPVDDVAFNNMLGDFYHKLLVSLVFKVEAAGGVHNIFTM